MAKNKPKQSFNKESERKVVAQAISQSDFQQKASSFQIDEKWIPAILAGLIFISYIPVWENGFVWDDKPYILLSDMVKNFDLKSIFTDYAVGNYHPLTMLSLAIEWALVKDQTWLYHLDNLILHTINSWLVFKLLQKLNKNFFVSFVVAVLFAIHPLHVESVAWAAERKDVLYTLFLLLSIWYYIKFDESQNKLHYGISILLFIASCMSKGMGVVLPALLIITDYAFLKKPLGMKMLMNKIPYFIITLTFAYIATKAQKDANADASSVISAAYTLGERILITCYAFCFYWVKTILPINLYPFYPYPAKPNGSLPGIFSLAFLGVIAIVGALWWFGRKDKRIWWAGAFFLIAISTVIQFPFPVGSAIVADRYYYLSSIGPLFILGLIFNQLYTKSKTWLPILGVIALGLCGLSFKQTGTWKNGLTLFTEVDKAYPNDAMILSNLGWHYLENKEFPTAKRYLKAADDSGFKNGDVCRTIGSMFLDEGDPKTALAYFEKATQYLPKSTRTNWLFATAYYKMGDNTNAKKYYKLSLEDDPKNAEYWNSYGLALTGTGEYPESRKAFEKALELKPDYWDAYLNHSFTFRKEGDFQTEIKGLEELLKKNPNYLVAYRNIGVTYVDLKQNDKAVEYWKMAAAKDTTGEYEYNIGINFANRGDINTAKDWYIKSAKEGNQNARGILQQNGVKF